VGNFKCGVGELSQILNEKFHQFIKDDYLSKSPQKSNQNNLMYKIIKGLNPLSALVLSGRVPKEKGPPAQTGDPTKL
jgi:hypothetical protein